MKAVKLTVIAILLGCTVQQIHADQTNVVQNLTIQLFGVSQGDTVTNRSYVITPAQFVTVNTRRVMAALAAATGNSLSYTSRLVVVTPLGGGNSAIEIRDGNTRIDVTSFFTHEQLSDSVVNAFLNRRNGRSTSTTYNIQRFALQDTEGYPALNLHFDVRGFATDSDVSGWRYGGLNIDAAGTGDRGGDLLILQGEIYLRGGTLEVVPDDGGGGGDDDFFPV